MAAFSHQHSSFLLDSIFLPSFPIKMSGLLEEGFINNSSSSSSSTSSCFPCSFPSEPVQETPFPIDVKVLPCSDNGNSITEKQKTDSSSMVLDLEVSDQIIQSEATPLQKKRRNRDGSCLISSQSKDTKKAKPKRQKKCNGALKETEEKKSKADKKNQKKVPEFPITGYVHVRARRGEATDSHSLAERVRRERISERLKMLQGLVPGCDKVTSKALMLDEIINYVQSLQHQVEFLSMKLSSVSPIFYEFGADFDAFMPKSEKQSNLVSPLPSLQQSIPTPSTAFADTTTTFTTTNNYSLLDNSVALLLQQGQRPNSFSQDNGNLLWDVDDQRQRLINQSGFTDLCSFQESNIKPAPTNICNNNRENNPRNPEEIKATFLSTSIPMEWASSTLHSDPIQVELKGVFGFEYGRNTMKAEEDEEEQLQSN